MKKLFSALFVLAALASQAQVVQIRYLDEIFTDVQIDNGIVYAHNFSDSTFFTHNDPITMDVYRPLGDTATNRPVILLTHNGSFVTPDYYPLAHLCMQGMKDSSIVELCKRFAKRGFVAVSFDYRVGWRASSPDQGTRKKTIIQAVYRAMQDAKSLVRYFKNDYANGNQWGIDTGKIVIGGSNSGAYVALAAGSLNDTAELNNINFVDANGSFIKQDSLGDFDGFGGVQNHTNYPGISSRFQCVLALGGAVGGLSWIQAGEPPVIAFHGVSETNTPYNTAVVITATNQPIIEVSGSGDFMPVVESLGNNNVFKPNNFPAGPPNQNGFGQQTVSVEGLYPFYGQYFEPWNWYEPNCYDATIQMLELSDPSNPLNRASRDKASRYIDTVMGYTLPRLYKLLIDHSYTGIENVTTNVEMSLFPNPANTELNISIAKEQKPISTIRLFDVTGRVAKEVAGINSFTQKLDISEMTNGIYLVSIKLTDGTTTTRKVAIEK